MCILYTLLTVVGYYDLSVLSMSVRGFKKSVDGCELYPNFFGFCCCCIFTRPVSEMKSVGLRVMNTFHYRIRWSHIFS